MQLPFVVERGFQFQQRQSPAGMDMADDSLLALAKRASPINLTGGNRRANPNGSSALRWIGCSALHWLGRPIGVRRPMQFGFVHAGLTGVPTFFVVDQAPSPMALVGSRRR